MFKISNTYNAETIFKKKFKKLEYVETFCLDLNIPFTLHVVDG